MNNHIPTIQGVIDERAEQRLTEKFDELARDLRSYVNTYFRCEHKPKAHEILNSLKDHFIECRLDEAKAAEVDRIMEAIVCTPHIQQRLEQHIKETTQC